MVPIYCALGPPIGVPWYEHEENVPPPPQVLNTIVKSLFLSIGAPPPLFLETYTSALQFSIPLDEGHHYVACIFEAYTRRLDASNLIS